MVTVRDSGAVEGLGSGESWLLVAGDRGTLDSGCEDGGEENWRDLGLGGRRG